MALLGGRWNQPIAAHKVTYVTSQAIIPFTLKNNLLAQQNASKAFILEQLFNYECLTITDSEENRVCKDLCQYSI